MDNHPDSRTLHVTEPRRVPWLSVVFGYGPMLPVLAGAAAAWVGRARPGGGGSEPDPPVGLCHPAVPVGVRRGLSFRTEGGARLTQVATMLGLFSLGFAALVLALLDRSAAALVLLLIGYTAIAVLDPIAARRGEAPCTSRACARRRSRWRSSASPPCSS